MTPTKKIPRRPFDEGSVSIVGLGCSSFSTFFWSQEEHDSLTKEWSTPLDTMDRSHPRVQEWIRTIHYAVRDAGINLLDTAPWYGHGSSETVIGWALEDLFADGYVRRDELIINTKIGRYEGDPKRMFDYSRETTIQSVQKSLKRMKCHYIDVLQLHDPEFAPSLDILLDETIPALLECQAKGWCRKLGMTGYPLSVQRQILERSRQVFGREVWHQALTYGHYNLHDTSLFGRRLEDESYADYCQEQNISLLAAAPLSMGLLTDAGPPEWHPAREPLKVACTRAAAICSEHNVSVSTIALLFALSNPRIASTILGMKDVAEVETARAIASRFTGSEQYEQIDALEMVLDQNEKHVLSLLRDPEKGPFAEVWKNGTFDWDGVQQARDFWINLEGTEVNWHECK